MPGFFQSSKAGKTSIFLFLISISFYSISQVHEYTPGISFSCLAKALGLLSIILGGERARKPCSASFRSTGVYRRAGSKVLEKTLESSLESKEIKAVSPKGNQPWIFIGRTDAEAEAPIFWPPDGKNWLIGNDPDAGKDRWQEEKGTTEDEMVGWHHQTNGHEFEQALGDGEGLGKLACCSPWVARSRTWLSN